MGQIPSAARLPISSAAVRDELKNFAWAFYFTRLSG